MVPWLDFIQASRPERRRLQGMLLPSIPGQDSLKSTGQLGERGMQQSRSWPSGQRPRSESRLGRRGRKPRVSAGNRAQGEQRAEENENPSLQGLGQTYTVVICLLPSRLILGGIQSKERARSSKNRLVDQKKHQG